MYKINTEKESPIKKDKLNVKYDWVKKIVSDNYFLLIDSFWEGTIFDMYISI